MILGQHTRAATLARKSIATVMIVAAVGSFLGYVLFFMGLTASWVAVVFYVRNGVGAAFADAYTSLVWRFGVSILALIVLALILRAGRHLTTTGLAIAVVGTCTQGIVVLRSAGHANVSAVPAPEYAIKVQAEEDFRRAEDVLRDAGMLVRPWCGPRERADGEAFVVFVSQQRAREQARLILDAAGIRSE